MIKITKAVFPVAGLGTRFLPATKASPKEMLPIVDKPLIQYAVEEAVRRYGVCAGGARLEGGTSDLHAQGEALVAKFIGTEDALISSMGFATNSTFIPALVGKGCLVISDELNHSSIRVGVRLSGADVRTFKHNDMKSLESLLRDVISQGQPKTHRQWKKIMIIVEGLYSMEGTLVNLPAIVELKKKYKVCAAVQELWCC